MVALRLGLYFPEHFSESSRSRSSRVHVPRAPSVHQSLPRLSSRFDRSSSDLCDQSLLLIITPGQGD
jgi:hypothetical protein